MALTRTLTFNLTATLTGTITSIETEEGNGETSFAVWTGPSRPPDLFTDSGEATLSVSNSFSAVGIVVEAADVTASSGAEFKFSPGDSSLSNGFSISESGGNFAVFSYINNSQVDVVDTGIPLGKFAFVLSRHSTGFRFHLQTTGGLTTYNITSNSACTNFFGYYSVGTLPAEATEWWTGPIEADQISGTAQIEAWLAEQFA